MGIRVCTWVAACVCACMGLYLSNNVLIITGHLHTVEVIEQNNLSASRQRKCAVCFCCPGRVACRLSGSRNVWEWRGCGCSALRAFSCWCASALHAAQRQRRGRISSYVGQQTVLGTQAGNMRVPSYGSVTGRLVLVQIWCMRKLKLSLLLIVTGDDHVSYSSISLLCFLIMGPGWAICKWGWKRRSFKATETQFQSV